MGISAGITAHHSRGLAIRSAAATSIAHSKIAIRIAAVRVDTICMEFPRCNTQVLWQRHIQNQSNPHTQEKSRTGTQIPPSLAPSTTAHDCVRIILETPIK
jgi:hypothetical protein